MTSVIQEAGYINATPKHGKSNKSSLMCSENNQMTEGRKEGGDSHSSQRAVSPGLSLFVSITEVQSSLVHSQQLTDAVMAVELSIFIHHLRNSRIP